MKIRTVRLLIKESFVNINKNKLMSITAFLVTFIAMIISASLMIVTINLQTNAQQAGDLTEITAFCESELDDVQIQDIYNEIVLMEGINKIEMVSKEEALEVSKEILGDYAGCLDGLGNDWLPVVFYVTIETLEQSDSIIANLEEIPGIYEVDYSQEALTYAKKIAGWGTAGSIIGVLVLALISILLISNTVKLGIYSRRKEIMIMKYVGASDEFIKWPFVIEGIILGTIASVLAGLLVMWSYNSILIYAKEDYGMILSSILKLAGSSDMSLPIALVVTLLGTGTGIVGSTFSLKRYLKV